MKGLKKKDTVGGTHTRLPITIQILHKLKGVWLAEPNQFDAAMLWAASSMCFFGFLRAGEVVVPSDHEYDASVHLSVEDVLVDNTITPQWLEIQVKASKMDPFRKGVSVYIGVTGGVVFPVAAILDYRVRRGSAAGPFFRFSDGRFLTRQQFITCL